MNNVIKRNGYSIPFSAVGMLDRTTRIVYRDGGRRSEETGIYVRFRGGGGHWIADPEAAAIEQDFMKYDGVQERPELDF